MYTGGISFLLVVPLMLYILLAIWHPLTDYVRLPEKFNKTRLVFLVRLGLILIMIATAVVHPTLNNIRTRIISQVDESGYTEAYADIHDGAIQIESALHFLSNEVNPYVANYAHTPLQFYGFSRIEMPTNPAFEHFVYLPGFLLFSYPVFRLFEQHTLPYDQRWIYLAAYVMFAILLPVMVQQPTLKLTLLAGVALNPLLTRPVMIGMNDVVILLLIFLTILTLSQRRLIISAIFLGLACASKQSAGFFLPFYVLLLQQYVPRANRIKETLKLLAIVVGVAVIVIGPFVVWNPRAFFLDVFAYPGGAVAINYPIRGHTLGTILVSLGIIPSALDPFPFWILQISLGLPLLAILMRFQWQRNGIGTTLLVAGIYIFLIGFVSRFFQDNYVGFVIVLILSGICLMAAEGEPFAMHTKVPE